MKEFKFISNIKFHADDIDDAFSKLKKHFDSFSSDHEHDVDNSWFVGSMALHPVSQLEEE